MAGRQEESSERRTREKEGTGKMTVEEAGHLGGQRVRELVQEGKEMEREEGKGSETGKTTRSRSNGSETGKTTRSRSNESESTEESRR